MPVPFGIARAAGRSVIRSLFDAGYSANSALRLLVHEGVGYRREVFLADWREQVSTRIREGFFRTMPKYVRPTRAMMIEKATLTGDKYKYTFEVDLYDPVTGVTLEDQIYSVGEDRILTVSEAEADLAERLETVTEKGMSYVKGTLISVKRK